MSGYIGTQPVPQATQTRDAFTATAGQTSFATSGYTPDYLDVYLNGIKLAAADYTASNGSDVVLASGAALNDILEVVAYSSFEAAHVTGADDFTVTGSFTSQGIDDNATSTAMTLDGSGNLLVGKTSLGLANSGVELREGAASGFTRNSTVMDLNRTSSDGEIMRFRKDGSVVGSIGATGGYLTVTASGGSDAGAKLGNSAIFPCNTNGSDRDAGINLGLSTVRWKDLYLSGGVYLGGTGSANKLDDYEEGTWTPGITYLTNGIAASMAQTGGSYTKVGRCVTVNGMFMISSTNSGIGYVYLTGLPFTVADTVANTSVEGSGLVSYFANLGASVDTITLAAIQSGTQCEIYSGASGSVASQVGHVTFAANAQIRFSITYFAA